MNGPDKNHRRLFSVVNIMGGSASKTEIKQLSEQITNIAMNTVQNCEVATVQDQTLEVTNTGFRLWGDYRLTQQSDISADCFNNVQKQIDLQNNLINTISQATTSQNVALLGAFGTSNSEAMSNLTNIVRNNITMSNIQNSYNSIKQTQKARFTNSGVIGFEQVELTQGGKIFAAATLSEVDRAGIFNSIATHVDQSSAASMENPLDFIAKAIGAVSSSITMTIIFFIIIIAIAVLGVVVVIKMLNSGPSERTGAGGAGPRITLTT